ncbi:MAG: hypothetical protein JO187_03920, partial [Acidobacteria bacterium]|nr:hypothetical protein [Acidobacteriota bacterium]
MRIQELLHLWKRWLSAAAWLAMALCVPSVFLMAQTIESSMNASGAVDSTRKSGDLPAWFPSRNTNGETAGGYEIKQSAEFGGRVADFSGNSGMWQTFVDLDTGPRLLEYTFDMHSPEHVGTLFDDLSFANYGYGGDPNNLSRVRIQKGRLYDFSATFRRNRNIFDYDLLGNPLNPANSHPSVPVDESVHEVLLRRRMYDVNLNLLPLGPLRFKLGWSRVTNQGTAFSNVHQGTEALVVQPTSYISDTYHFGVALRAIPRTSINYDQFYTFMKNDTAAMLSPFAGYDLANGTPVELGTSFNTPAGQPCATPVLGTGFANPACNGYFSYFRGGPTRTSMPAEQFSFQTNYIRRVDVSGRFNYSSAENNLPGFVEAFEGMTTRTRARDSTIFGTALTHRIGATADFAVTLHVTDALRLSDTFRFENFRIPGAWSLATSTLYGATLLSNPNVYSSATCPPPYTAATCPQHSASSGPDSVADQFYEFIRHDEKVNTAEIEYDFTRRITAHAGYRYEHRDIRDNFFDYQGQTIYPTQAVARGCPTSAGCTLAVSTLLSSALEINGHSLLAGFTARPTDKLKIGFDTELFYADNAYTRISPRHLQAYKLRVNYKPAEWIALGSFIDIRENRNTDYDVGNLQHNRRYSFSGVIARPEARWGVDIAYDYNDVLSLTNICFTATPGPVGALSCGTPYLLGTSLFNTGVHYGAGSLYLKPVSRMTLNLGYAITSSTGTTLILDQNSPTGPLNFYYHLPTASVAFELNKKLTYKAGWNYYGYNEKSDVGPTLPRNFRGNVFTVSLRY